MHEIMSVLDLSNSSFALFPSLRGDQRILTNPLDLAHKEARVDLAWAVQKDLAYKSKANSLPSPLSYNVKDVRLKRAPVTVFSTAARWPADSRAMVKKPDIMIGGDAKDSSTAKQFKSKIGTSSAVGTWLRGVGVANSLGPVFLKSSPTPDGVSCASYNHAEATKQTHWSTKPATATIGKAFRF